MNDSTNTIGSNEVRVYAPSDPLFSPEALIWSGTLNSHQTFILAKFVQNLELYLTFSTSGGLHEDIDLDQVRRIIIDKSVGLFLQGKLPLTTKGALYLLQQQDL